MRYNIYIRKEDEYLWEKIENKSEWIRERLHEKVPTPTEEEFEEGLEGEPTDDLRIT